MPAEEVKARCQSIADAINAIPEDQSSYRELRRARGEIDALARDLGEPESVVAGDECPDCGWEHDGSKCAGMCGCCDSIRRANA